MPDPQLPAVEIDVIPSQAESLTLAQPNGQGNGVKRFQPIPTDSREQLPLCIGPVAVQPRPGDLLYGVIRGPVVQGPPHGSRALEFDDKTVVRSIGSARCDRHLRTKVEVQPCPSTDVAECADNADPEVLFAPCSLGRTSDLLVKMRS